MKTAYAFSIGLLIIGACTAAVDGGADEPGEEAGDETGDQTAPPAGGNGGSAGRGSGGSVGRDSGGSAGAAGSADAGPMTLPDATDLDARGAGGSSGTADAASGGGEDGTEPVPDAAGPTGNWASGSTPAVILIDVGGKAIPKDPKIPGRLTLLTNYTGPMDFAAVSKASPAATMPIGIGGHGFGSYNNLPKKSYNVELRDAQGNDSAASLLGLPKESDFVLYACYSDKTCLRNLMTYWLGWQMGMKWAPRTRWAEVFVDGKFQGLYVLVEKIKKDSGRVNIPRPAADLAGGDLSGGYIIRREGWEVRGIGWYSPVPNLPFRSNPYIHHFPKYADLTPAQKVYIRDFFTRFETTMKGVDWADPAKGYRALIDETSWADYALLQELANNTDGYFRSVYMTKRPDAQGGKLEMHPLWDYDLSYGNVTWRDGNRTDVWAWGMNRFGPCCENVQTVPFYWERMLGDPPFRNRVKCRWQELRKSLVDMATLSPRLDEWAAQIRPAINRNQAVWHNIGTKVWPNYYVGATYDDELKWLKAWIDARIKWIDKNLPGTCN